MTLLTDQATWQPLEAYYRSLQEKPLQKRIDISPLTVAGLSVDYSRNHLDQQSLLLFSELAEASHLSTSITRLLQGEIVNLTEQQPAWHTTLRDLHNQPDTVKQVYRQLRTVTERLSKQGMTDIIHVGAGASYWGPRFLFDVFSSITDPQLHCHFITSHNQTALEKKLLTLDPQKTVLVIVSKSFTTVETMNSARFILSWLQNKRPQSWQQQVFAVTAERNRALAWGISSDSTFLIWDWVGGRFSLWSAVSFCIVMAFGWPMFEALLQGAHAVDQHFQSQPWHTNVPVLLAFIGLIYRHFFSAQTQAIIPYHSALTYLPSHLQQLHMESLGKQVTPLGIPLNYPTGPIIWGGTGLDSQHSVYQWLLQGHDVVPIDFIVTMDDAAYNHCLTQAELLLSGNLSEEPPAPQRLLGNRPSTIISMSKLTPQNIGALLAMYEHKVFTQSILWNINAFDQWGVEAGKQLAKQLAAQQR